MSKHAACEAAPFKRAMRTRIEWRRPSARVSTSSSNFARALASLDARSKVYVAFSALHAIANVTVIGKSAYLTNLFDDPHFSVECLALLMCNAVKEASCGLWGRSPCLIDSGTSSKKSVQIGLKKKSTIFKV